MKKEKIEIDLFGKLRQLHGSAEMGILYRENEIYFHRESKDNRWEMAIVFKRGSSYGFCRHGNPLSVVGSESAKSVESVESTDVNFWISSKMVEWVSELLHNDKLYILENGITYRCAP